jgi:HEAT repeat protein
MQVSLKKQVERLTQENEELKRTLAESLALKEQVQKLRQQNEELKRVVTDALAKAEKTKPAERKTEELEKAVAAAVDTEQPIVSNEKTDAMVARLEAAIGAQEKVKYLRSLGELTVKRDPSLIGVVRTALSDPDVEVGRVAIELLADYTTPEILPALGQALSAEDEQIRMQALVPLQSVNDPQVGGLLAQALGDTSEGIRSAALGLAAEHGGAIELSVLREGITSPHEDVKYTAASILETRADHAAVDVRVEGLRDKSPEFREEISAILGSLLDTNLKTYDEAQAWWAKNRKSYDNDLFKTEPN